MKDKIIGVLILGGIIVGIMWALEIGPFKKYYPPLSPYSGSYEPSFTGGLSCSECGCPGWDGSPSHGGVCGRKISAGEYCTHTYTEHRRAGD